MPRPRRHDAVVFHDFRQAQAAFDAAQEAGCELHLLTPSGGQNYAGPGYYQEIVRQVAPSYPSVRYRITLDCGDDAALALAALNRGWKAVVVSGRVSQRAKVESVAKRYGSAVVMRRPHALDPGKSTAPSDLYRRHFGAPEEH